MSWHASESTFRKWTFRTVVEAIAAFWRQKEVLSADAYIYAPIAFLMDF